MRIVRFYLNETNRIYGNQSISAEIALAIKTLNWLHTNNWKAVTLKDLYQKGPRGIRSVKIAKDIIKLLREHRWLMPAGQENTWWVTYETP